MASHYKESESAFGRHFSVSAIQADAAYFGARLALKEGCRSESRYQEAELKAFESLNRAMIAILHRLKRGGYSIEQVSQRDDRGKRDG